MINDVIERAMVFASVAHRKQRRLGSDEPYIRHCARVANAVRIHGGGDRVAWTAAYLHDVLEDTDVTPSVLESEFGGMVAEVVAEVTRPAGMTSKAYWRHLLEAAPRMSHAARLIKVADAVDNVRDLARDPTIWGPKRVREYVEAKEALIAAIGDPWPDLVKQFTAEAAKVRALIVNGRCNAQAFLAEQSEQAAPDDAVLLMRRDAEGRSIISYANLTPEGALMLATLAGEEALRWERED